MWQRQWRLERTGVNSSCRRYWRKALHSPSWHSKGGFLRGNYNNGFKKEEVRSELSEGEISWGQKEHPLPVMKQLRRNQDRLYLGEGWIQQSPGTRQAHSGCQDSSLTVTAALWQGLPSQQPKASKALSAVTDKAVVRMKPCTQGWGAQLPPESPQILSATLPGHSSWKRLETPSPYPFLPQCLLFFFSPEHSPNFPVSLG